MAGGDFASCQSQDEQKYLGRLELWMSLGKNPVGQSCQGDSTCHALSSVMKPEGEGVQYCRRIAGGTKYLPASTHTTVFLHHSHPREVLWADPTVPLPLTVVPKKWSPPCRLGGPMLLPFPAQAVVPGPTRGLVLPLFLSLMAAAKPRSGNYPCKVYESWH